jgi:hypothetical protein
MSKVNTNQATFANWVNLIDAELETLDNEGMEPETCKIIALRDTDRLIEGENKGGDTIRGWLIDGESIRDIRWEWKESTGWPTSVSI